MRIASKYPITAIDKTLFYYRVHDNNMHQNIAVMEKDHITVYNKAKELGFFKSYWFKQKCYANLYLILAGSWWKDGGNKSKGLYYIFKSLITYPPIFFQIILKIIK